MDSIYSTYGIYRITNITDGKSYIGKTGMNFGDRWDSHRSLLNSGKHDNQYLQNAWNKYGKDNFEFAIIEVVDNVDLLNDLEIKYIAKYREMGLSYNIQDGGDGGWNLGRHLSDETKKKIGAKNRVNMTGRKLSGATRQKMSESQKKRYEKWTDEDRAKYGEQISKYASGYHWSEESRQSFSKLQQKLLISAKYTPDDIRAIRFKRENGAKIADLAKEYDTTQSYISAIIHGRRWGWLE